MRAEGSSSLTFERTASSNVSFPTPFLTSAIFSKSHPQTKSRDRQFRAAYTLTRSSANQMFLYTHAQSSIIITGKTSGSLLPLVKEDVKSAVATMASKANVVFFSAFYCDMHRASSRGPTSRSTHRSTRLMVARRSTSRSCFLSVE